MDITVDERCYSTTPEEPNIVPKNAADPNYY
jgi:hypothetical protein